jgi:signal transduction histidine kinase
MQAIRNNNQVRESRARRGVGVQGKDELKTRPGGLSSGVVFGRDAARAAERERVEAAKGELYRRFADTEEAERRQIARELHDVLGQSFTVLKLLLHRAGRAPEEAPGLLKEAGAMVDEMVSWSRDYMVDLQIHALRDTALGTVLAGYFERYSARTGVQVHFKHTGVPDTLPYETSIAVYRIIQEALTNLARRAGVTEVHVQLEGKQGTFWLRIGDRGNGLDSVMDGGSIGMWGMKERVRLLGGDFHVDSQPGGGTCIVVRLPGECMPAGKKTA